MPNTEDRKLVIFGWIVTMLGLEVDCVKDKELLKKVNDLTDKLYDLGVVNPSLDDVTRLEVVDYTNCESCSGIGRMRVDTQPDNDFECPVCHGLGSNGRNVIFIDERKQLETSLQDDGRTLKIFISKRV